MPKKTHYHKQMLLIPTIYHIEYALNVEIDLDIWSLRIIREAYDNPTHSTIDMIKLHTVDNKWIEW